MRRSPFFGLDHGQLTIAIFENVVRYVLFAAFTAALKPPKGDYLTSNSAALDDAPARRLECGVDMFGSGYSFVQRHQRASKFAAKGLVKHRPLQLPNHRRFVGHAGCELDDFFPKRGQIIHDFPLYGNWRDWHDNRGQSFLI